MRAYCFRNGEIGFGYRKPKGALPIAAAKPKLLKFAVTATARHSYATKRNGAPILLVPGVAEAGKEWEKAINAVIHYGKQVQTHLNPPPVKPGQYQDPRFACLKRKR